MTTTDQFRRRYAIGDIHGCANALSTLTSKMELTANDLVVVLGDTIDRGPDSSRVLELLLEIRATCQLIFILGNHEEMLLDALQGLDVSEWLRHGGLETLESYGGDFRNIPEHHLDLLYSALKYWEGSKEICIHANLEPGVELHRQRPVWLRWHKLNGLEYPHPSGKRIVCGHSGVGYEAPLVLNGWVCLDTLVYAGGYLTALDLDSGEITQAKENGEFRGGVLLSDLES